MTQPRRLSLIGAALAVVLVGFAWFSREPVPEYGGRDAWSWFRQYESGPGASPLNRETEDAFAAMGEAAVPFLWRVINQSLKYLRGGDLNAAAWLARWEPPHEAGIAALAKAVGSGDDGHKLWVMEVPYAVGPRARAAIPALEAASRDPRASVRDAARCTLRKVRGEP